MLINPIISCGKCGSNYATEGHQPFVFPCGHGACESCVLRLHEIAILCSKRPDCHRCPTKITIAVPNYDLIAQISLSSQKMKNLAAEHQANPQKDSLNIDQEGLWKNTPDFEDMIFNSGHLTIQAAQKIRGVFYSEEESRQAHPNGPSSYYRYPESTYADSTGSDDEIRHV